MLFLYSCHRTHETWNCEKEILVYSLPPFGYQMEKVLREYKMCVLQVVQCSMISFSCIIRYTLYQRIHNFPFIKVIAITMLNRHTHCFPPSPSIHSRGIGVLKINSKSNSKRWNTKVFFWLWNYFGLLPKMTGDESNPRFVLLCVIYSLYLFHQEY